MRTSISGENQSSSSGDKLSAQLDGHAVASTLSAAGGPDDPIMRDALLLMEAFLAIEDAAARTALITLAKSLVSYDWLRKAQGRR